MSSNIDQGCVRNFTGDVNNFDFSNTKSFLLNEITQIRKSLNTGCFFTIRNMQIKKKMFSYRVVQKITK